METPQPTLAKEEGRRQDLEWGSPQTLKSSAHAKPPTHLKPEEAAGGWGGRDPGRLGACQRVVGSGGKGAPPAVSEHPQCPPHTTPLSGPLRRLEIPHAPSPREVLGVTLSTPKAAPPSPARDQKREGRLRESCRDPPAAGRPPTGSSPGHPRAAQTGGGGAGTGAQVSGVPTAPVKCSALPLPTTRHQRDKIRRETPAPRRPPTPGSDPTRDPRIRTPDSGLRAPGSPTSFVNSPLPPALPSGAPGTARPLPPAASPQRAEAAPVPAAATAAARPLPSAVPALLRTPHTSLHTAL
ncbi:uncharacterized protein LOC133093013 [Eubalaena glacialis]|uniref:uncharacterized protein LOC133093013 n=1 Tax=Eubalaena glacialis TaxID=27606 RepID=UPI002A5A8C73|nr:uncharacterized protein LOC133093013 [Eubalaena glacialis]